MLAHFTHGVLVARSDHDSVGLGYGLTRVELLWLRARIIRVLGGRGVKAPRPKRHATAGRSLRPALIGLTFGIVVAHAARGPLAPCLALPFLQHVVSVGAALGLITGLLARRHIRPAILAGLVALFLFMGTEGRSELVQSRPYLPENPRYLRSAESIGNRRYLAGFLPVAALVNLAGLELSLTVGEALWRRRRARANRRTSGPST